ncbi:hypothetical protein V1264_022944 [Littorina saxatilis]|uniref:Uncharacterized protein n=1 Tax=Littorina saxatilis TaxID=31220 RepID=A0AAN9B696_9CAEN
MDGEQDPLRRHDKEEGAKEHELEDEGEGKRGKFQLADYMISTTGFQGPSKMWEAPHKLLKVLWLLAFLVACAVMVFQLVELFKEFYSFPVKTQVKLKFSPLALPALTFCNVNPIRKSYAANLSCAVQQLLELPDEYKRQDCRGQNSTVNYYDFSNTDCHGCVDPLDSYFQRRFQIDFLLGDEKRSKRVEAGHQIDDMIVDCFLFGRRCSFLNVTAFLSADYGNCYTISAPNVKASRSGPGAALDITFNLEPEEFVTSYKTGYGLRVVLHENGTRAFPSTEGFTISSGTETNVGLKLTEVTRKIGYGESCEEDTDLVKGSAFKHTLLSCRDQCLRSTVLKRCKCVPIEDEADRNTVNYCTTESEFQCKEKVFKEHLNATESGRDLCVCKNPCKDYEYGTTISSRVWPLLSYVVTLEDDICTHNRDSPKCSYSGQNFTVSNIDYRRSSFARLRLYYERLNYESVEESPFYDTERFLSDIGGTLGLWIGVTVLGLAELLELLILCLLSCSKRMRSRGSPATRPNGRDEKS